MNGWLLFLAALLLFAVGYNLRAPVDAELDDDRRRVKVYRLNWGCDWHVEDAPDGAEGEEVGE